MVVELPLASVVVVVLVVLCVLSVPEDWAFASAGLVGVWVCDINFGVLPELFSAFGVVLSD